MQTKLVYRLIEAALLTCGVAPDANPEWTELELLGAYSRAWAAWKHCSDNLAAIAAGQQSKHP